MSIGYVDPYGNWVATGDWGIDPVIYQRRREEHMERLELFMRTLMRTGMRLPDILDKSYAFAELLCEQKGDLSPIDVKMVAASALENMAYTLGIHASQVKREQKDTQR